MPRLQLSRTLLALACLGMTWAVDAERPAYVPSTWTPRVVLPAADALSGTFAPPSPEVKVDYSAPGFSAERLTPLPAPGVHPRVLLTPQDVETIRAKVALGDQAPVAFRKIWERVAAKKSAFYALVMRDDVLGRDLAARMAERARQVEPMVERVLARPGLEKDNLWALAGTLAGEKSPDAEAANLEQWQDYDYLYGWLAEEDRTRIRHIIARMTAGRSTNYLEIPDHWAINNHLSFGINTLLPPLLLIEGEDGFDRRVCERSLHKLKMQLSHYFAPSGMCYETIKGWLDSGVLLAAGRRDPDVLRHGHLRAKMGYQLQAMRWEIPYQSAKGPAAKEVLKTPLPARWRIREEMRNSAWHVNVLMHWLYPQDRSIDFLYKASLATHQLDDASPARDIDTVGTRLEAMLLLLDDGLTGADGKPVAYDQAAVAGLGLPATWNCPQRGYLEFRNSWRPDDLHFSLFGKQDFIYNGHEGPEQGRFLLWKDGINWAADMSMLFNKTTGMQNMVTVDGRGATWPPVSGTWLGVVETPQSATAVLDYRDGFSWTKVAQVPPFNAPQVATARFKGWDEGNFIFSRDMQLPFHDVVVRFNDRYSHTDYGTWNGENRVSEYYRPNNPMESAFRTIHAVRGERPYVLFLDDLVKDGKPHLYEWNMTLPGDMELISSGNGDLLFGRIDTPRSAKTVYSYQPELTYQPRNGDPVLLVRVLGRNGAETLPTPHFERFEAWSRITVPTIATDPSFKILLYPHRFGDPLPTTGWSEDKTRLSVAFPGQRDDYRLGRTDGGRTILAHQRDGKPVAISGAGPARPVFQVRGATVDAYDARYRRDATTPARFLADAGTIVTFDSPPMGQAIHYTLDGSEPTAASPRAVGAVAVTGTATLRARTIAPGWAFGPEAGAEVRAEFTARAPEDPDTTAGPVRGLVLQTYEIATVLYDNRGFFDAQRIMMPDVRRETPTAVRQVADFHLPDIVPSTPQYDQKKGFFRLSGRFKATAAGIYRFAVDSAGPVTLDINHQTAVESIGQYHQQQQVRSGEVALAAGWHTIALTVCDPVYWKVNSEGMMPLRVTYRHNGGAEHEVTSDELSCDPTGLPITAVLPVPAPQPVEVLVEPGLEVAEYDRHERVRAPDLLDIDEAKPFARCRTEELLANPTPTIAVVYNGYFQAPVDGLYVFDTPARTPTTADRNQLRIGGEIIVQRGVPGRLPGRAVQLKAGLYPFSLRLGASRADATVTYPGTTNPVPLTALGLFRAQQVAIVRTGQDPAERLEVYGPTDLTLTAPAGAIGAEVRYTTDGSLPTAASPVAAGPLTISRSTTVTAAAFRAGKALTVPSRMVVTVESLPQAGLCGWWDFAKPEALATPTAGHVTARVAGATAGGDGSLVLAGEQALLHVDGLAMAANVLTVSLWVNATEFGKNLVHDGKYRTVINADAGATYRIDKAASGGKPATGTWQHVVFAWDGREAWIAVDGQVVARGERKAQLHTDSLDLLKGFTGKVRNIRIYNRALDAEAIACLAAIERSGK